MQQKMPDGADVWTEVVWICIKNGGEIGKRIYDAEVIVRRGSGIPTSVWMELMKNSLRGRGLTIDQARATVHDRTEWSQSMSE